jgi:hypothetical protein
MMDYIELFWALWQPQAETAKSWHAEEKTLLDLVPTGAAWPLSEPVQRFCALDTSQLLNTLEQLERDARVAYEPDADDWAIRHLFDLVRYVHIGAARALALKRSEGYSDDVVDCLERVRWAGQLVKKIVEETLANDECLVEFVSINSVTGLALLELFHVRRLAAKMSEAIHLLVQSLDLLSTGLFSYGWLTNTTSREIYDYQNVVEICERIGRPLDYEKSWRYIIFKRLAFLDLTTEVILAKDLASHLLEMGRDIDWKTLAKDIDRLADSFDLFYEKDRAIEQYSKEKYLVTPMRDMTDEMESVIVQLEQAAIKIKSKPEYIVEFLDRAAGRFEERMTPDQFREFVQESEDRAAEKRLKAYFFDAESWGALPERAQRSLIDAERTWFSSKAGRIEGALIHLQTAIEGLLQDIVWDPLVATGSGGGFEFLELLEFHTKLQERNENPTLGNYVWICSRRFYREYVSHLGIPTGEKEFLLKELSPALDQLRTARNAAQHDPTRRWTREEVTAIYRKFMGIGSAGVIPRLATIKARAMPRQRLPAGLLMRQLSSFRQTDD